MMSGLNPLPCGLVVVARDATGHIITRITSHRDLVGAIHTARSILKLKPDAARVEVHAWEPSTSQFQRRPLAVLSREDVPMEQLR
jgi:hypothetical protein